MDPYQLDPRRLNYPKCPDVSSVVDFDVSRIQKHLLGEWSSESTDTLSEFLREGLRCVLTTFRSLLGESLSESRTSFVLYFLYKHHLEENHLYQVYTRGVYIIYKNLIV